MAAGRKGTRAAGPAGPADAAAASARAQGRLAALVVLVTMPLWLLLSWAGGTLGWPVRYAFLIDFAALGAFAFALIVLYRVRRRTRAPGS